MSDAYYARYTGDYQRDTAHLSLIQHGAYGVLLDHYYATGKPLPTEKEALYRLCRAFTNDERRAVDSIIGQFFQPRTDGLHNKRADAEIEKREKFLAERSESGRRGAASRWHGSAYGSAIAQPMAEGVATTSITNTITNTTSKPKPKPESCASHTPGSVPLAPGVCEEILAIWNAERGPLPEVLRLTKKRRDKILGRVREDAEFSRKFRAAVQKAVQTPFLCGAGERGWRATLDWLVANDTNTLAVLEGKYDGKKGGTRAEQRTINNLKAAGFVQ
jgi:uncharacterized protein YdaU (DUF1376 family)